MAASRSRSIAGPSSKSSSRRPIAFVVQGGEAVATVQARYYFGQPVANARVRYVVNQQPYYSPLRWNDGRRGRGGQRSIGTAATSASKASCGSTPRAAARSGCRSPSTRTAATTALRIEAQVTDASSREVSGNTVVHATYGPFLLSARVSRLHLPAVAAVSSVSVRARRLQRASPQPGVPSTLVLEHFTYPAGLLQRTHATEVGTNVGDDRRDGRQPRHVDAASDGRVRTASARSRDAGRSRDHRRNVAVGCRGSRTSSADEGDRYLELMADKRAYAPGETARLVVRGEPISGPMLVTKEGQHVTWHRVLRPAAGDAIEVPIDAGDVGDIYVNIAFMREGGCIAPSVACRCRRPNGRCRSP